MSETNTSQADVLTPLLQGAPVVPLVQSNNPDEAVKISEALLEGGLKVLEVVLRTDEAYKCLEKIVQEFPDVQVGAGTVISADHTKKALDCGAKFIVAPGLTEGVVSVSQANNVPVLPGVATASELQRAWNMGLRTVKFFPASLAGGPKMLKALSSVFRDVSFMPTGGVNAANLTEYLTVPAVLACGGSWLTPKDEIAAGNFEAITKLAAQALEISKTV